MKILAGIYKNLSLKTPKSNKTRPTLAKVRASVFNMLQTEIEGARFLDVFAGSGSMGLEALSRGASSATFIEKDRIAARCIKENLSHLKCSATVLQQEAKTALTRLAKEGAQFEIIYLDPPYELDILPILHLLPPLLVDNGLALVEQSAKTTLSFEDLELEKEKTFGDTTLFLYRKSLIE